MANALDYPVTFGYGATEYPWYYTPTPQRPKNPQWVGNYHRGDDRAMPVGTPVVVNGVTIGLSGNSGASSGPHLHTGRYVGGGDTNPRGGGKTLEAPVVVATVGEDSGNGKYVRLTDGDGVQWVYLHLSRQDVKQGQTLQGGSQDMPITKEQEQACAYMATGGYPGKDYSYPFVGTTDVNGMLTFWQTQITKVTAQDEQNLANAATGSNYGAGYNSQYQGKPWASAGAPMGAFWRTQRTTGDNAVVLKPGKYQVN